MPGAPVSRMCRAMYSSRRVNIGCRASDCTAELEGALDFTKTDAPFEFMAPYVAIESADFVLVARKVRRDRKLDMVRFPFGFFCCCRAYGPFQRSSPTVKGSAVGGPP